MVISTLYWCDVRPRLFGAVSGQRMVPCKHRNNWLRRAKGRFVPVNTQLITNIYALFTRPLCKSLLFLWSKVSSSEWKFCHRKHGVRFGVFVVCGLVNYYVFLPNRTPEIDQTVYPVSYRPNFCSPLETSDHKSRLLYNGRVNKACIFVISCVFTGTNL